MSAEVCTCGSTRRCWLCKPGMFPNAHISLGITEFEMKRRQKEFTLRRLEAHADKLWGKAAQS